MAIAVTATYDGRRQQLDGRFRRRATLTVTGLTAAAANSIPHGLPATPARVIAEGYSTSGGGAVAPPPSLDGSTVAAGFDATNVYVNMPAGVTTCQLVCDY